MAKVLGVGGVFFKADDPTGLQAWYARVLGFTPQAWGGVMFPHLATGVTTWSPFKADTDYFAPSNKEFMFNLIVDDMDGMLARCARAGVTPIKTQDESYGRFAHIMDLEGRKIELWEPKSAPE